MSCSQDERERPLRRRRCGQPSGQYRRPVTIFSADRWTRRHSQRLTTDRGPVSHFRRDGGTERAVPWNWQ